MAGLPDNQMQNLLRNARKYSDTQIKGGVGDSGDSSSMMALSVRNIPIQLPDKDGRKMYASPTPKRTSVGFEDEAVRNRRLSEAGVNRRLSASHVLTEDTDSFIIGDRVHVDGIKPGRIQYIGVTKFGPGDDWAGVFLDEPLGKNDGAVGSTRYFSCEPKHGVFSKLHRLTREPLAEADEALKQMRKYGYDVLDSNVGGRRRDSVGSGGGRRESINLDDGRTSTSPYNRKSLTPEPAGHRRDSTSRYSPDSHSSCGSGGGGGGAGKKLAGSKNVPINRKDQSSPSNRRGGVPPYGRSPLASPRNSSLEMETKIDKDPEMMKLMSEARRLSMSGSARRTNGLTDGTTSPMTSGQDGGGRRRVSDNHGAGRRISGSLGLPKRAVGSRSRSGSESENHGAQRKAGKTNSCELHSDRKLSGDFGTTEPSEQRRLSDAGFRKRSSTSDTVLNEDTGSLMVGLPVWVDGTKKGRIAFIGNVHFAKGEMAGVHLDQPTGKNNGNVGGIMYFQCEPKRGIFSRLHRLTTAPITSS